MEEIPPCAKLTEKKEGRKMTRRIAKRILSITLCMGLIMSQSQFAFAGGADSSSDFSQSSERSSSDGKEGDNSLSNGSSNKNNSPQGSQDNNSDSSNTGDDSDISNPTALNNDNSNTENTNNYVTNDNPDNSDNSEGFGDNDPTDNNSTASNSNDLTDLLQNDNLNNTDYESPNNGNNTPGITEDSDQNNDNSDAFGNDDPDNNNLDVLNDDNLITAGANTQNNDDPDLPENEIQDPDDIQNPDIGQNLDPEAPAAGLDVDPNNTGINTDPNALESDPSSADPLGLQTPASTGENGSVQPLNATKSITPSAEALNTAADSPEPKENSDLTPMSDLASAPKTDTAKLLTPTASTPTNFEIDENGVLTGFDHPDENGHVEIPDTVTEIGYRVFSTKEVSSVTIPSSVKKIGYQAFSGCYGLKEITIPNSVEEIGDDAFWGCGFTEITIPNSVRIIGDSAFYDNKDLSKVELPNSITKMGDYVFGFSNIEELVIPDNTVEIGEDFCVACKSLKSVKIGSGIKNIPEGAFLSCDSLESVTFPNDIETIGKDAFSGCKRLNTIELPSGLKEIDDYAFASCGLTSITIPEGVKSIKQRAFSQSSIEGIIIPDSVTEIEKSAFGDCTNLKSVVIGTGINTIPIDAFSRCTNLESIVISENIENIETYAFNSCTNLKDVVLPSTIRNIGERAFCRSGLKSIIIPDGVNTIKPFAFSSCMDLETVSIPASVVSMERLVFGYCPSLKDIYYDGTKEQFYAMVHEFDDQTNPTVHFKDGTTCKYRYWEGETYSNDSSPASDNSSESSDSNSGSYNNSNASSVGPNAGAIGVFFDANFYALTNPDAANDPYYGQNANTLYEHYLLYSQNDRGRYPYKTAAYILKGYSDAGTFLNDLNFVDGFAYNISQWKNFAKVFIQGAIGNTFAGTQFSADTIAYDYMNDPVKSRKLLSEIINELCNTESSESKRIVKTSKFIKNGAAFSNDVFLEGAGDKAAQELFKESSLGVGASSVEDIASITGSIFALNDSLSELAQDYSRNMEILNSIGKSLPADSELKKAVDSAMNEYQNGFVNTIKDIVKESVSVTKTLSPDDSSGLGVASTITKIIAADDTGIAVGEAALNVALGHGFGNGEFLMNLAVKMAGSEETVGEADKIIMSAYMRNDALQALTESENALLNDPNNIEKQNDFVNMFNLTKALTKLQYDNMYSYYSRKHSNKAKTIGTKLEEINALDGYQYMNSFLNKWKWRTK